MATRVWIALGANLGQPREQLRSAVSSLSKLSGFRLLACSSLYRTQAVSAIEQPDYLNAVVLGESTLSATGMLRALLQIERDHGRTRGRKDEARTLDLDLLSFGDLVVQSPELSLPHPRMHQRAFVLAPLCELDPSFPLFGRSAQEWLELSDQSGVVRLTPAEVKGVWDVHN